MKKRLSIPGLLVLAMLSVGIASRTHAQEATWKKVASFSVSANDCSASQQTYRVPRSGKYKITAHTQGETCYDCTGGDKRCHGPEGDSSKKGNRRGCPIGALGMSVEGRTICPGSFHEEEFEEGDTLQFWFADDKTRREALEWSRRTSLSMSH